MILLYRGNSIFSKAIKWRTWGDYSHAAWWREDGTVIESWQKGGVTHSGGPATLHKPGTEIDVFDFVQPVNICAIESFLFSQLGHGYDFSAVLKGFTFRLDRDNPTKWFCSELVHAAANQGGFPLLERVASSKVHPTLLSYSPLLEKVATIVTTDSTFEPYVIKQSSAHLPPKGASVL